MMISGISRLSVVSESSSSNVKITDDLETKTPET